VSGHRDPRCSYTASRGVNCRGQLNAGDHPKYLQKPPIAVVIFSEHVKINRGDGCSNKGSALAVLYLTVANKLECQHQLTFSDLFHVFTLYQCYVYVTGNYACVLCSINIIHYQTACLFAV